MGIFEALWGGFSAFFSIWQLCILQISPFFMLYLIALYIIGLSIGNYPLRDWVTLSAIAYTIGFSILFSLVNSQGLEVGRVIFHNIKGLRFLSGIYILLVGLYIISANRINLLLKVKTSLLPMSLSLLLGAAFAIVYLPCITPTLSRILGLAIIPEGALRGSFLAFFYGIGMGLAFYITGLTLIYILKRVKVLSPNSRRLKGICGLALILFSFLSISNLMVYYKAFILMFF